MTHVVESLDKQDRSRFDCGVPALTTYLRRQAGQEQRRRVASCFLLVNEESGAVDGYYTLSAASVKLTDLPASLQHRLPRYERVPMILLGRLAVDVSVRGRGFGAILLADAIDRAAALPLGAVGLLVDAADESARAFYEHHGFSSIKAAPDSLLRRF